MPALLPFVAEAVRRLPTAKTLVRLAFGALVAASFAIGAVGAATDPGDGKAMAMVGSGAKWDPAKNNFMTWATTPEAMATWNNPLLDWSAFPVTDHARELRHRQNIISRFLAPGSPHAVPLALLSLLGILGLAATWYAPKPLRTEVSAPEAAR
jgi:hypothetical protein